MQTATNFPWKEIGYAFAFVFLLLVAYVVAYYVMVGQSDDVPTFFIGGEVVERFFEPMLEIDKRIRPKRWQAIELPSPNYLRHPPKYIPPTQRYPLPAELKRLTVP